MTSSPFSHSKLYSLLLPALCLGSPQQLVEALRAGQIAILDLMLLASLGPLRTQGLPMGLRNFLTGVIFFRKNLAFLQPQFSLHGTPPPHTQREPLLETQPS